ncbi:MAG: Crp/Fnr family transcriptional regulator, partial [Chloroflexota bacterium]
MSRQEQLFSLRRTDLFRDLAELDLSDVLDHSTWVSYDRGELIASPDELVVTVLVIVEGCACLYRMSRSGQLLTMATLRSGAACGLLFEVIGLQPKSMLQATAQDTTVCRIPAECLRSKIHVQEELATRAFQITTVLLAEAYDRLEDLGLHDV